MTLKHLVFDLDDTLLDTSRQLIPRASRDACQAMIEAGLSTNVENCLEAWANFNRDHSRSDLFSQLVVHFGVNQNQSEEAVASRGFHAFYNRRVETDISLFPGTQELLLRLHDRYVLHLVTSGSRKTQEEKIRILEIAPLFTSIHHVDPSRGQKKREAFALIQQLQGGDGADFMSIGNRVDTDIAEAKIHGWKTCWIRYGEYASMLPRSPTEEPDFTLKVVTELGDLLCQP